MGSRSRPPSRGRRPRKDESGTGSFYVDALRIIEKALGGEPLSWNERAMLWTKLPLQLPRLCERHRVAGSVDGFVMVLHRLGSNQHLEFFDRDILKKLVSLLQEIATARGDMLNVDIDIVDKLVAGVKADMKADGVL